ncbi:MAG: hypothetical protein G01um101470_524 [Parcubacteria group bacterium Gr01-1014_70]|nr:MAG: hypothetical protein G01um101470_524 [Parcubacteria group bacterium Gr01-1014_70]
MKNTVCNRETKNVIIFVDEAGAIEYVQKNNKLGGDGAPILFRTSADICSNCGCGQDVTGWCPNYCTNSETKGGLIC